MNKLLNTPLWQMTGADYLELHKLGHTDVPCSLIPGNTHTNTKQYVYGLKGIRELCHVSHTTAQKLKDGILKPAVRQCGRKIIVDAEMALDLFGNKK